MAWVFHVVPTKSKETTNRSETKGGSAEGGGGRTQCESNTRSQAPAFICPPLRQEAAECATPRTFEGAAAGPRRGVAGAAHPRKGSSTWALHHKQKQRVEQATPPASRFFRRFRNGRLTVAYATGSALHSSVEFGPVGLNAEKLKNILNPPQLLPKKYSATDTALAAKIHYNISRHREHNNNNNNNKI